jgi:hypothetical protein
MYSSLAEAIAATRSGQVIQGKKLTRLLLLKASVVNLPNPDAILRGGKKASRENVGDDDSS